MSQSPPSHPMAGQIPSQEKPMQFTVAKDALVKGLTWVARSLPSRPATPILAGVKITVADDVLTLSTFDYEQSADIRIPLDTVEADGTVVVAGRLLSEIAKALPAGDVEMRLDGTQVRLSAGKSKFTLPVMPADEYPTLPAVPAAVGTVDGDVFAAAVKQVSPATGTDENLPVLTTVRVVFDPETGIITLSGTDRYRVAAQQIEYTPAADATDVTVLVPAKAIDGYAKALGDAGEITLAATQGMFAVSAAGRTATTRLIDGEFPPVERLFPNEFAYVAGVPVAALVEVVRRVQLVAERITPVRLTFEASQVTVSVGQPGEAAAGSEVIDDDISYEGEAITCAFNVGYLLDGLGALGTDRVTFNIVQPTKPMVLLPDGDDLPFRYLIMPVRATS